MHSPFPHSNSVWILQEEFSAAEEDNEGDEPRLSKSQSSAVYTEQPSYIQVNSEATFKCKKLHIYSSSPTFINAITASNNPITLILQFEGNLKSYTPTEQ